MCSSRRSIIGCGRSMMSYGHCCGSLACNLRRGMLSGSVVPKGTRVPFRAFTPHSRAGLASHVAGATGRSSSPHKSSSYHLILPLQHDPDRLRVRDVLLLEDTSGEGVLVVIVVRKHRLLHDDG